MYKKIYIEITNNCNLDCDFCVKNSRPQKFINNEEFNTILSKLEGHTNYLYFHVLGEPLLHPSINELINSASKKYKVNLTTNGYLINRIIDNSNIRQVNISLHAYNPKYKTTLGDYMNNIFNTVDTLSKTTYISYRLWANNPSTNNILEIINKKYNTNLTKETINRNVVLAPNVFISSENEFVWPDLNNEYYSDNGTCYAIKDHIGILVDGTVIPCCLDSKGIIKLGNIYKETINDIMNKELYQNMLKGFQQHKKICELCKHCNFIKK